MNIEWDKLGFEFMPTRSNVRASFKDGKWSEPYAAYVPYA